jgi:ketosteroid isomerase-like protein
MSGENAAIAREVLAAWNAQDLERWLGSWDPTCVWVPGLRGQTEGAQSYRGHEGLRTYWAEDNAVWGQFLVEVHDVREKGSEVVAITTGRARGRHSDVEISEPMAFRFRVRHRKVVRGESYLDVEEALEAMGLRDG